MKKWLFFTVIILVIALVAALKQVSYANQRWTNAMVNVKAYSEELAAANEKSTVYKMTIDQLEYYRDSVLMELDKVRKELGIKDKRLQAMQYIGSNFSKADTVVLQDTIFKEAGFKLDTMVGDKWYKIQLGLRYPSEIAVKPEFRSEKYIVVSSKKETVNPPKKFFLFRWFQRRHTVLHVDVVERNPYVENQSSKYIEIIK